MQEIVAAREYCNLDGVKTRFDTVADIYDGAVEDTNYLASPHMLLALEQHLNGAEAPLLDILDLGCGTGLCGAAFERYARRLVGVDLSTQMLEKARVKDKYDELWLDDVVSYLSKTSECFDLVTSAGVFAYVNSLQAVLDGCRRVLRPGGRLLFTVDCHEAEPDVLPSTRSAMMFMHSKFYVAQSLQDAGFELSTMLAFDERLSWRDRIPVPALLVLAIRSRTE